MPETVLSFAPSSLATSSAELNMPLMKAVFLKTLDGVPTSFSFLTTETVELISSAVPVSEIRKPDVPLHNNQHVVNIINLELFYVEVDLNYYWANSPIRALIRQDSGVYGNQGAVK